MITYQNTNLHNKKDSVICIALLKNAILLSDMAINSDTIYLSAFPYENDKHTRLHASF